MSRILKLTVSRPPFDVMVTGEKGKEYRQQSKWIWSRLVDRKTGKNKQYDYVEFKNGYSANSPTFVAEYLGYEVAKESRMPRYSNGLLVQIEKDNTIIISLGKIISTTNV